MVEPIPALDDSDVERLADMAELVRVCDSAVAQAASGQLVSPARQRVRLGQGGLVFTVGGNDELFGFRAYGSHNDSEQEQVVAVWGRRPRGLRGLVVGELLGAYRTGAIGGAAINRMASYDATTCAVIGTGLQARTQLIACAVVRQLSSVRVYSRSLANRLAFAHQVSDQIGLEVTVAHSAAEAIDGAEIVILATSSGSPVIDAAELAPNAHVSTIGPKRASQHELPMEVAEEGWVVATDAPAQVAKEGFRHFLYSSPVPIRPLGEVRISAQVRYGRTVFLSAGLAGTEVLVANSLLSNI